jgi:hypothetical protein
MDLDKGIEVFNEEMRGRNDRLIVQSKRLLWLSQGEVGWKRLVRGFVFNVLEVLEVIKCRRRGLEKELYDVLEREGADGERALVDIHS